MFKVVKTYLLIFITSVIIGLYLFEFLLFNNFDKTLIYYEYFKSTGKKFDKRSKLDVFYEKKKYDPHVVIDIPPSLFNNNKNLIPLAGISNSNTIFCNENGYFSSYLSDRYGFNNPDEEWDKKKIDYILLGDSFVQGACVDRPNDIASNLRKKNYNVLNFGYATNGPLLQLASLKEFRPKNVKNVLWFFYEGNDLNDLDREKKSNILSNYLYNKNFSQNIKDKQDKVDSLSRSKFLEIEKINKKLSLKNNKLKYKLLKFVRLDKTKKILFKKDSLKNADSGIKKKVEFDYVLFESILLEAKRVSEIDKSNFYFIYLPWYYRYERGIEAYSYDKIKKIVINNNINFIDMNNLIFEKEKFPLKYFPFRRFGHYNEIGYLKVSNEIIKKTTN